MVLYFLQYQVMYYLCALFGLGSVFISGPTELFHETILLNLFLLLVLNEHHDLNFHAYIIIIFIFLLNIILF